VAGAAGQGGAKAVVEAGPGQVLSNLARRAWREVRFLPVGTAAELDMIVDNLRGALT
jgi:malonyl CoA-acyl carrier protein transacylase